MHTCIIYSTKLPIFVLYCVTIRLLRPMMCILLGPQIGQYNMQTSLPLCAQLIFCFMGLEKQIKQEKFCITGETDDEEIFIDYTYIYPNIRTLQTFNLKNRMLISSKYHLRNHLCFKFRANTKYAHFVIFQDNL